MALPDPIRGAFIAASLHLGRLRLAYALLASSVLFLGLLLWSVFLMPPSGFPTGTYLTVPAGTSIAAEAAALKDQRVIVSPFVFKVLVRAMPGTHRIQSGIYLFRTPTGVFAVAWRISHGISGIPQARVTFPEGYTARQMGETLSKALPGFDSQKFDSLAIPHEGYLFPDTYFFLPGTTEATAIKTLLDTFQLHIAKYADAIAASGHSERDIVTMASILEGEGKTLEDKRIIAGILWRRIAIGMPLQVDAAFGYIYGRTGYTPTAADMRSNSGYNTYRYKGLPQTPINNPGDISLEAALTPAKTDYLYYLTGTDGQMHYASTLAEHVANEKKYLK